MVEKADFDALAAHRHFSASCFNRAWALIEKPDRSEADDPLMVTLNQASIFHWLSRPDCTARNLAIGYWQASRIQALLRNADQAMAHARICLDYSTGLGPFHLGYAYEALARAAGLANCADAMADNLLRAENLASRVADAEDRRLLTADLKQLRAEE